ncbi:Pentatricopeptide repeat (PPR) superfamily protein [Rhynchospora pubera]|uniref:Pentatricopeptide repeat (PPR) superfamily protein n=1 Tax=Rhynchospora pubera TaxID=906938 RepID=A0AAV8DAJ1_9POAL|nr:Pentatricopeptide repeat (PPR) superfamily protein [Rhynchospora pubera]
MENTMRKLQQRYRRASEEMEKWEEQQSYLLSSFNNASSIIDRLQVLRESKNYGTLQNVSGIKEALLAKQLDSLETYFFQMRLTLKEFHEIVKSLDKIARDANQIVKSGSSPTSKQMQLRVGIWSSLKDCLDGLISIRDMHQDEYNCFFSLALILVFPPLPFSVLPIPPFFFIQNMWSILPNVLYEKQICYSHCPYTAKKKIKQ